MKREVFPEYLGDVDSEPCLKTRRNGTSTAQPKTNDSSKATDSREQIAALVPADKMLVRLILEPKSKAA